MKQMRSVRSGGYDMTVLDARSRRWKPASFRPGSFYVDMAQPMANAAFYYLEPQARDGFVMAGACSMVRCAALTVGGRQAEYPVFKMRRQLAPGK
jgi:hypothetical protein